MICHVNVRFTFSRGDTKTVQMHQQDIYSFYDFNVSLARTVYLCDDDLVCATQSGENKGIWKLVFNSEDS